MRDFTVIREFGLWRGDNQFYRLVRLDTTGISPYAIQYGEVSERSGAFTVIDAHRHDAQSPVRDAPQAWAHEWMVKLYEAKRELDYESTMRLYERLGSLAYGLLELDMCANEREELRAIAGAVVYDLRRYGGFDPRPDFPGLERTLLDRGRNTTGSDTTGVRA